MTATLRAAHDAGQHSTHPHPNCLDCRDDADLAEGFARQNELDRISEEVLDSQEEERNSYVLYGWGDPVAFYWPRQPASVEG